MPPVTTIDLTILSKEELIEIYENHNITRIAHYLWCLEHPDIPVNFSSEFVKLLDRIEKLLEMNGDGIESPDILLDALIDSIYTDCRALFCESEGRRKNYTLQNCLNLIDEKKAVEEINKIIDSRQFEDPIICRYSFRKWVKFVTDRAIAHKDNLEEGEKTTANYRYEFLNNPVNVFEFQLYIYQIHNIYEKIVEKFALDLLEKHKKAKQKESN
ncbi:MULTISPECIES: hypothetical protein [Pantoea]|uniref:hypothetical protein n=1 Tax=Pantoea TaxID=53335 RepID=UPI0028A96DA7|nr:MULTISPECIES: hypothetical protein [Pantoea]MDU4129497.1 hypothetical protein [Pantoea sp.]